MASNNLTSCLDLVLRIVINFDRYANRAKNIKNKPKINEDPKDALLREFQEEIARLKAALQGKPGSGKKKRRKKKMKRNEAGNVKFICGFLSLPKKKILRTKVSDSTRRVHRFHRSLLVSWGIKNFPLSNDEPLSPSASPPVPNESTLVPAKPDAIWLSKRVTCASKIMLHSPWKFSLTRHVNGPLNKSLLTTLTDLPWHLHTPLPQPANAISS